MSNDGLLWRITANTMILADNGKRLQTDEGNDGEYFIDEDS